MGFLRNLFKKRAKNQEKLSNSIQLPTNSANFMFDPCPNTLPVLPTVSSYYRAAVSIETPPRVGSPHRVGQMHEAESRSQRSASRFVPNCFTDHYFIADSDKQIPRESQKIDEVCQMQTYPKGTNSALPRTPLFSRAQPGQVLPPPSKQGRRSSNSILPAQLNSTLSQISSEVIDLAARPFDEKLVNAFQDSRPTSPLSRLSPGAESASPCTSIWSPMECSTSCSPQLSPKGRHYHGSSVASPQRDSGRIALPLPLPPVDIRKIEPITIPVKPVPMPLPLPYEEALCPGLCCKNREGTNFNSDGDIHRYSRTQLSSPITSPRGFSQSCHQHSPNFSPYHSPYRSSCPSPLASPSPVGSPTPMPQCPRKWQRGQELGRGSFGTVYEGWNLEDGSFFAVKISSDENFLVEVQQEVAVLSRLHHPNIVRYLGTSIEDGYLCIFLELMKCSLQSILKKYKRFEEDTIRSYTRQILYGLQYLHQRNTMHRDIKCANILVDANGQVKLADFGVAKQISMSLASSVKGTPCYMAPEVIKPSPTSRSYGLTADIWSLGCTVLEMADGKPPWSDLPGFGFYFKVSRGELPPVPKRLSAEAKDFILQCLRLKPEDRPSASGLLQHPFVANASMMVPILGCNALSQNLT